MIILPGVLLAMPAGDDRAYMEWLYKEYYKLMFATAWKIFDDPAMVDDVVSESCLALMKKIPTLRELERKQLGAYIVSTIRNTALNFLNKQQRTNRHRVNLESALPETMIDRCDVETRLILKEELACVLNAIRQLPVREQQILRMKYVKEMKDREIAAEVGISTSSVRKYISRARDHIKAIIYAE